ncbi:MAG: AAA family ATPase [Propionibacteriaceae bacterium]|nr:AAA family ATPase [Propionibacteriaceae bacterium]
MRLHKITLRNFRGTLERTVTFGDGVTVVQGVNEAGKSSLMEGLRLLRQYKSSSNHSAIRAVKPAHRDEGPAVEAELSIGPHHVIYAKQWLRGARTILEVRGPRQESLTGEEAHNRFLALMREHVDDQLLEALEVSQGGSLAQAQLVNLPTLRRALDDARLSVADNDALMAAVQQEYQRYHTATGKPTGDYLRAERELEELQRRVEQAAALGVEVDELTARHEQLGREHDELGRRLRQAHDDHAAHVEQNRSLEQLHERVATAQQQTGLAEQALGSAVQEQATRDELVADLDQAETALAQLHQDRDSARAEQARAEVELQQRRDELDAARGAVDQVRGRIAEGEEAARRYQSVQELAVLAKRRERLRVAEQAATEAARRCEAARIDAAVLRRLEEAEVSCRIARGKLEAAAASYQLEVLGEVLLDGEPLPPGRQEATPVSHPLLIEVPGQLSLVITPDADASELDRDSREAEEERAALLAELKVTSLEEARQRMAEFNRLSGEQDAAEIEVKVLLGEDSRAALEARVEALQELAKLAEPTDGDNVEALPALRAELKEAEARLQGVMAAQQSAQDNVAEMRENTIRAEATLAAAKARGRELSLRLEAARARRDDADLAADVLACRRRLDEAVAAVAALERELTDCDAEGVRLRLTNAEALIERLGREEDELEAERLRIETLLADRMATGPYDLLNRAAGELEALTARQEARHRAARAVARLAETLTRHRDQAQLRYVAPFKERIEALGRPVFGADLEVEVSPELRLVSRTLNGITVPFAALSAGAREQLALIGRLACAELVDPDEGAPVMIDDALGFADPERIRSLAAVLGDVGSRAQIIILSCQPERFGHIGKAAVVRI